MMTILRAKFFRSRLAIDAGLYLVWLLAFVTLTNIWTQGMTEWFGSWSQWDARMFERIWDEGFGNDAVTIVFPPGFAYLVGALSRVMNLPFHIAGMVLNVFAFFGFAVVSSHVLSRTFQIDRTRVYIFTLLSPMSYFAFACYSDALFALILWSLFALALYGVGRRARVAEFLLLFLAPWIRLTGYALAAWLVLRRWCAVAVLMSLLAWLALNMFSTGHLLSFLESQKLFLMPEGSIIDGFAYSAGRILPWPGEGNQEGWSTYVEFHVLPLLYLLPLSAIAIMLCRRKHWLLGLTVLSILFVSHNQAFWRSAVRYDLPLMPFLCLPLLADRPGPNPRQSEFIRGAAFGVIVVAQFVLQIYFANTFKQGDWAF